MQYTNIFSLVPDKEKESYIDNTSEGVWLSHEHLSAINSSLEKNTQLDVLQQNVDTLTNQLLAKDALLNEKNELISTLTDENIALKNAPSGNGTSQNITVDPVPQKKNKLGFFDDNHPLNVLADSVVNNKPQLENLK